MQEKEIQELRGRFRGEVIGPADAGYEAARKVYNAMIDRRPALVVKCADVADVMAGVNLAREKNLLLAVRGGAHNGPGLGVCDGGLVLDLSRLKGIRVDQAAGTVRVEGGALWGDVDHATHPFGLAVPCGFLSTTGVGGLTLGGGIGYLARQFGLSIDSLLGVDVVLADGRLVTASADLHPDLFWAVRGAAATSGSSPPSCSAPTRSRRSMEARSSGPSTTGPRCCAAGETSSRRRPRS
jgi:FAD/FMN-containing dehydrogenase